MLIATTEIIVRCITVLFTFSAQHVKYPDDPLLKFKAVQKQHTVPFFFVCDFESFIVPVHADEEQEEEDE